MSLERPPSGIPGLDNVIGGFIKGSLILLAGSPGTGKTIFAAEFLHYGASHGEAGVYVSLAENRETFYNNMHSLGLDFDKLEKKGKFKFLDMLTVQEKGIARILEMILDEIHRLKASRLVIDSFSAMAQAFQRPIDARIILHTILGKILRQAGCTSLLLIEIPTQSQQVNTGSEEFVADGVITLKMAEGWNGDTTREIEISKMRGTMLPQKRFVFTLRGGFRVLPPFTLKTPRKAEKYKTIPDSETHFSTGSRDLDKALGGGYRRGTFMVLEADTNFSWEAIRLFTRPVIWNFLSQGRGVSLIPTAGFNSDALRRSYTPYIGEATFDKGMRIYEEKQPGKDQQKPYTVLVSGRNPAKDMDVWREAEAKLRESTGKPILKFIGYDRLEAYYAHEPEKFLSIAEGHVIENTFFGDLTIGVVRPGQLMTQRLLNIVDWHLCLVERYGTLFCFGAKPRTGTYAVESGVSEGHPTLKLTQIV